MTKYIDAEKLIAEIKRMEKSVENATGDYAEGRRFEQRHIRFFITSLQQEKPLTVEDVVEQCKKFGGHPKIIQHEQQEVDLAAEYDEQFNSDPVFGKLVNRNAGIAIARHFYELGLNARKED